MPVGFTKAKMYKCVRFMLYKFIISTKGTLSELFDSFSESLL